MDEKPIRMTVAAWQDITKRIRRVSEELRELHLLLQDETKLIIEEPMPQEEWQKEPAQIAHVGYSDAECGREK